MQKQTARFWTPLKDKDVQCTLCPHCCIIKDGRTGICAVRKNEGGVLYSLVWGVVVSAGNDPIEKKPLFHFYPGTKAFSIATMGCNLQCTFCQNSDISQLPRETGRILGERAMPDAIVAQAQAQGSASIAYTYTEPTVFLEYVLDTAASAKALGIKNVMITNGFTSTDIIQTEFPGLIDAANIDLKAFSERFYKELCKARLGDVCAAIEAYHAAGIWIEITTLLIPGENDSFAELTDIARFIASMSPDIPWHISRYYPRYHYDKALATPVDLLEQAREIGLENGLKYVYSGNVPGQLSEHTYCPACRQAVIKRQGYRIMDMHLQAGLCAYCQAPIAGRFTL